MTEAMKYHLLDVASDFDREQIIVYDLSYYYNKSWGSDKKRYEERISFTIKGNLETVHIIDSYGTLDYEKAKKLAIRHVKGDYTVYRLD